MLIGRHREKKEKSPVFSKYNNKGKKHKAVQEKKRNLLKKPIGFKRFLFLRSFLFFGEPQNFSGEG